MGATAEQASARARQEESGVRTGYTRPNNSNRSCYSCEKTAPIADVLTDGCAANKLWDTTTVLLPARGDELVLANASC